MEKSVLANSLHPSRNNCEYMHNLHIVVIKLLSSALASENDWDHPISFPWTL